MNAYFVQVFCTASPVGLAIGLEARTRVPGTGERDDHQSLGFDEAIEYYNLVLFSLFGSEMTGVFGVKKDESRYIR